MLRVLSPDEEKLERTVAEDRRLQESNRRQFYIYEQMRNCPTVTGEGIILSDTDQQMGYPLTPRRLEKKLNSIISGLVYQINPNNKTKKAMYLSTPEGLEYLMAYENSLMPEHSIMRIVTHEYPDPAIFTGERTLERDEVPAYEKVEDPESPVGYSYEFDPKAKRPGMIYVEKGFGEATRGWRTVLLRLIQRGLASVELIEKTFKADDRAEWAKSTGKQTQVEPTW